MSKLIKRKRHSSKRPVLYQNGIIIAEIIDIAQSSNMAQSRLFDIKIYLYFSPSFLCNKPQAEFSKELSNFVVKMQDCEWKFMGIGIIKKARLKRQKNLYLNIIGQPIWMGIENA